MRDPDRIPVILEQVRVLWEKNPDWRLCQLVVNVAKPTAPCPQIFNVEDEAFQKNLEA